MFSAPPIHRLALGTRASALALAQSSRVARALLKDAPIVLFDEATAALDAENEAAIVDAMHELARDRTVVVIAHRLSTIAEADSVEYEGKTFILLVPVTEEGELREEADPILARIEEEDGEEIFVSPTEAEFDAVIAEFEKASAEEEE